MTPAISIRGDCYRAGVTTDRASTDCTSPLGGRVHHELELTVPHPPPARLTDWLAGLTGLSRGRIKDAIDKGAVWHAPAGRRPVRVRRVTHALSSGDSVALYYDSVVLACEPPVPTLIASEPQYTVWDKPPGLLMEGSRFGDHATLERLVARLTGRSVWLPHRLDRDASGVMLVAHTRTAAARLSALFRDRHVDKHYQAEVAGQVTGVDSDGSGSRVLDTPLDDKPSLSRIRLLSHDPVADSSLLEVHIETGRYHQIRRHLAGIGHPILGDLLYAGRADPRGLRLRAIRLAFDDPWDGRPRCFEVGGLDREAVKGS